MKKIILTSFICLQILALQAQTNTDTKIADLLSREPVNTQEQLNANMETIGTMGSDGIEKLVLSLSAPGKGDNTKIEYAIKSFSYYSMQTGKASLRKAAAGAYCNALEKTTDKENKAFIIRQLEIVGDDNAVSYLQKYLSDERLADPAARALVKINSANAGKALLDALKGSSGAIRLTLIQALGDAGYKNAAPAIEALANSNDAKQNKEVYYALANIAAPSSQKLLSGAAKKVNYGYDVSDATMAYFTYLNKLAENGQAVVAEKAATEILNTAIGDKQIAARTAALKLLVNIKGEKSTPLLIAATKASNAQYREAALKFAGKYINNDNASVWIKQLATAGKAQKAEIITMLGNKQITAAQPAVLSALKSADPDIKLAAIKASGRIGGEQAIPALLSIMKSGNKTEVDAAKTSLLSLKGNAVVEQSAKALSSMPSYAKASLIEVLAARGADNYTNDIITLAQSNDTLTNKAAFAALKSTATTASLPQLYPLLLSADNETKADAVQDAIVSANNTIADTAQRLQQVQAEMQKAPADKQYRFFPLLAATGSKDALPIVTSAFANGDDNTKQAVIDALSNWPTSAATEPLFKLAEQSANTALSEKSFTSVMNFINDGGFAGDQKLLLLRRAMPLAKTAAQKQQVLKAVGRCNSLTALVYAAGYMDDASVNQDAAHTVANIALNNTSYTGNIVKTALEKTMTILTGRENEYLKQAIKKRIDEMPAEPGFVSLFNGKDLTGWKGLVANPVQRATMDEATLAKAQLTADSAMQKGWLVKDGLLVFSSHGDNLCTVKKYGDFEMYVDWKITKEGDAGIYLRGSPQVQIWDTSRVDVGAQVGSGGLYNNEANPSKPLKLADNAIGEWNTFHIIMKGERVTVYLNGELVVNNTVLENYWDRKLPIFPAEQIELQAHGTYVAYRDIYIKELPQQTPVTLSDEEKKDGFKLLFDGISLNEWTGNKTDYVPEDGTIAVNPKNGGHGNLYTKDEYSDFVYRFEFQLTPGANNGIGIRAPLEGDAAYVGMEIQVLDNEADIYKSLHEYQYHGSVYGVIPAKRGYLKPVGEWNTEEITAKGNKIKVVLNGTVILDGDITESIEKGTLDKKDHPGLKRTTGHIGFLGHGDMLKFRNIRVKDLTK